MEAGELVDYQGYDKTSLKISVAQQDGADVQNARVWVVESTYLALVQILPSAWCTSPDAATSQKKRCVVFELPVSAQVRASQDATAECLVRVLRSCTQLPQGFKESFCTRVQMADTDHCGTNLRAEQLLRQSTPSSSQCWRWHSLCILRKVHAAATKIRHTPSTAGNSMTGSERPSPEPLLKKEAPPAVLGGRQFWKCSGSLKCLEL